ncbi:MAG TPA: BON domain-containing protein [Acidobacteriaceae bacterium]
MRSTTSNRKARLLLSTAALAATILAAPACTLHAQDASSEQQAEIQKALSKKQFANVKGSIQNNMVVLTGTVNVFDDKEEAGKRARHVKGVKGIDNEIQVDTPSVPDAQLETKLLKDIEYDRVGYGTTAFNAISVSVQNGVVTLGGHAYGPVDAGSAVSLVSNTKGVRDVVNDIQLDPVSPMDDRIRIQTFRTIYSFPMLNKYALDPGKPIRISVVNGNVTLYGVVDRQSEKDAAGIRANTVPGVFKVVNNLQVAGQPAGKS